MVKTCEFCKDDFDASHPLSRYCSKGCKAKVAVIRIAEFRRQRMTLVRNYLGGKCDVCGYTKCKRALEAHHVHPENKEFQLSGDGQTRSLKRLLREADKCILLCANCHREYHSGLIHDAILNEVWQKDRVHRSKRSKDLLSQLKEAAILHCSECKVEITSQATMCRPCYIKCSDVITWPDTSLLQQMVNESSLSAVGRKLGVSGNAVKKRLAKHK